MRFAILSVCLFMSCPAFGQEITVKVKENPVPAGSFAEVTIEGLGANTDKIIDITPAPVKQVEVGNTVYFSGLESKYTVEVIAVNFDTKKIFRKKIVVSFAQNPQPPPKPDDPPTPDKPAPIPVDGFRVLIVYEFMDTMGLTAAQHNAIYGQAMRDYLDSRCPVGADGKTKEWRIWDKDINASKAASHWQDAMKRERKGVPWIIVSNGKTGFEGPLPKDEATIMELLRKY